MINKYIVNTISDKSGEIVCYETVRTYSEALSVVKRYAALNGLTNKIEERQHD